MRAGEDYREWTKISTDGGQKRQRMKEYLDNSQSKPIYAASKFLGKVKKHKTSCSLCAAHHMDGIHMYTQQLDAHPTFMARQNCDDVKRV